MRDLLPGVLASPSGTPAEEAPEVEIGNLRLDVPPEKLDPNAPLMASIITKEGGAEAGLQVHVAYATFTEPLVVKGIPLTCVEQARSRKDP